MDSGPAPRRGASRKDGCRWILPSLRRVQLVARMPAPVLAAIGDRALLAADGGGAIIIGPGAGEGTRSVVMQIAEPRDVIANVMMGKPRLLPCPGIVGGLVRD